MLTLMLVSMRLIAAEAKVGANGGFDLKRLIMPGELTKAHAKFEADCASCHASFEKNAQNTLCRTCHKAIAEDLQRKRGFHGKKQANECNTCHTEHQGRAADIVGFEQKTFDHSVAAFQLIGKHLDAKCVDCHQAAKPWHDAPTTCAECHSKQDIHQGRLGACEQCHQPQSWKVEHFDHAITKFPLTGEHARVECKGCHTDGKYDKRLSTECQACHKNDDAHAGKLGEDCGSCHVTQGWHTARFDHNRTHFPLLGAHARAECKDCHKTYAYDKISSECISCHRDDDAHKSTLPTQCAECHSPSAWKPASLFSHAQTHFPLLGKHVQQPCKACHTDALHFAKTPLDCFSCHHERDVHRGAFGKDCAACHAAESWKPKTFDHAKTNFPLRGAHADVACSKCHGANNAVQRPVHDCAGCHATNDPHRGQLKQSCDTCHTESAWKDTHFDHATARFPLIGAHTAIACNKCHLNPRFHDAPEACVDCHKRDDTHRGAFGDTESRCEKCHNTRAWPLGSFDHASTGFELIGAHARAQCVDCHRTSSAPNSACISCHLPDDIHEGAYGRQCNRCHDTNSYQQTRPLSRQITTPIDGRGDS